jgi:glucose/arabinose dehydrogenase
MRALLGSLALVLAAPLSPAPSAASAAASAAPVAPLMADARSGPTAERAAFPALVVRRRVRDLEVPWDVQPISGGRLLITERNSARLLLRADGRTRRVDFPSRRIWVSGETGLASLEIDPAFRRNGRFYTCSGWRKKGGGHDVRVVAWRLDDGGTRARFVETLVAGFPTSSGRHGGCRLLITRDGSLLVGTGDAAESRHPRNLRSLGGKTLRLDPMTGKPWPDNPWVDAENRRKRYVFTYGHRNVQGLAQRGDGSLWSVEHGPGIEDEVNLLRPGRDFGWQPGPGYDESVPMTDHGLPGRQHEARWSSGPTPATSGAAWVQGRKWGRYRGTLAVACLEGNRVIFMKFDGDGRLRWTRSPGALTSFGRLRSVTVAPNDDLLVTTSNGAADSVLRVSPRR